jgi:hypothetical protein
MWRCECFSSSNQPLPHGHAAVRERPLPQHTVLTYADNGKYPSLTRYEPAAIDLNRPARPLDHHPRRLPPSKPERQRRPRSRQVTRPSLRHPRLRSVGVTTRATAPTAPTASRFDFVPSRRSRRKRFAVRRSLRHRIAPPPLVAIRKPTSTSRSKSLCVPSTLSAIAASANTASPPPRWRK